MHTKPLVSVIIPAYNHEYYVQEAIKSIITQTYKNIELIVVDDGSKDSTWQKIQEMRDECEKRFKRVVFETKQNEGTCKTLNRLISMTQGEYIYLTASDDISKPNAIEKEVTFLNKHHKYGLAVGDNEFIDSEGKKCYWDKDKNIVYEKEKATYLTFAQFLETDGSLDFNSSEFGTYETLYTGNHIPNGYMIRKSVLDKCGEFTPQAPLEDFYLMLQISKYSKMKFLDEVLFSYRWHDTNTIKDRKGFNKNEEKTKEYEKQIISDIEKLKQNKILPEALNFINYGYLYKEQGIPFFMFQIKSYKKNNKRTKIISFFGKEIMTYTKKSK